MAKNQKETPKEQPKQETVSANKEYSNSGAYFAKLEVKEIRVFEKAKKLPDGSEGIPLLNKIEIITPSLDGSDKLVCMGFGYGNPISSLVDEKRLDEHGRTIWKSVERHYTSEEILDVLPKYDEISTMLIKKIPVWIQAKIQCDTRLKDGAKFYKIHLANLREIDFVKVPE